MRITDNLNPPLTYQRFRFLAVLSVMLLSNITPAFSGVQIADGIISKMDITSSFKGHDLDSIMIGFTDQDIALFTSIEDMWTSPIKVYNQLRMDCSNSSGLQ